MERKSIVIHAIFAGAILIASSATVFYDQALATVTISGQTKLGTSSLSNTQVSAEASNYHYHNTVSDANGFWSLPVDNGISYTVDASKYPYTHVRVTGVVGPQSGIIHTLAVIPMLYPIEFFIVADEDFRAAYGSGWKTFAKDKLIAAQTYFLQQHSISFKDTYYYPSWDSTDSISTCSTLLVEAKSETGWTGGNHQGANVLWAITTQNTNVNGCANIPGGTGGFPGSLIDDHTDDMARTVMHELSHNYGLQDTNGAGWWDIMDSTHENKNWKPSHDTLMISHRSWY